MTLIKRLMKKTKKYYVKQWKTQAGYPITNHKFKINFCLPEFRMTKIVRCYCNVYESSEIRYDMTYG